MLSRVRCYWAGLVGLLLLAALWGELRAVESGSEGNGRPPAVERGPDGLPKYHHPYQDGLYSTVTAMNMFPDLKIKQQKKFGLKVPGFRKEVQVYSVLQSNRAPLVVVLLGGDGKVEGPWGCLYPYWYNQYAYNVLTFDSTFTPKYPEICGKGVVGNFDAEADQVAAVIAAFLNTDDAKRVVTKVGVLGMSFGATQALLLAAKAKAGKLPFELSGCLALSPPVNMHTSARILDRFFVEDRWDTTMIELIKRFGFHAPVAEGQKIPFAPTEMRAAIGFAFRDGFENVVERNDRFYKLKVLPSEESGENRQSYAEAVGFEYFMEKFTFPYWLRKDAVKNAEELWEMTDLVKLLPRLPDYAQAIVTENDPFNAPEELAAAKAADANKHLITLPVGGHLGYAASDWMLVKALRIFNVSAQKSPVDAAPEDKRTREEAHKEALDAVKEALDQKTPPAEAKTEKKEEVKR